MNREELNNKKIESIKTQLKLNGELGQLRIINTLENRIIRREAKGLDSDELVSHAMLIAENLGIEISRSTGEPMNATGRNRNIPVPFENLGEDE